MKKIDELKTNIGCIKFYDGIDIDYASKYKGDDMLIFFVKNWEAELKIKKRDNVIDCILSDNDIDSFILDNNMIMIYQTNGFLMETLIAVKNKMKQEYIGTYNIISKK